MSETQWKKRTRAPVVNVYVYIIYYYYFIFTRKECIYVTRQQINCYIKIRVRFAVPVRGTCSAHAKVAIVLLCVHAGHPAPEGELRAKRVACLRDARINNFPEGKHVHNEINDGNNMRYTRTYGHTYVCIDCDSYCAVGEDWRSTTITNNFFLVSVFWIIFGQHAVLKCLSIRYGRCNFDAICG